MSRIKAILFDLGDTLIDFGPLDTRELFSRGARLAYRYLQQLGYKLPPFVRYHWGQFWAVRWHYFKSRITGREFNALDVLGATSRRMGCPLSQEQMVELAWQWYLPLSRRGTVEEGLHDMLLAFRRAGLALGIVSNTFVPGEVLDRHLAQLGLLEHFPVRVYSCDVRYRKPDPRIFQIALGRLGVAGPDTMFVGDKINADVAGAEEMEMISVLKDPSGVKRRRGVRPAHRITSLRELPDVVASYDSGEGE